MHIPTGSLKEYTFKDNFRAVERYIHINRKLTNTEQETLAEILSSFPHSNTYGTRWFEKFLLFDPAQYSLELLFIAANAFDSVGNTMLGIACEYGKDAALVQKLIDMGADLNCPDQNMEKLPLHWAIANKLAYNHQTSYKALDALRCLLNNGARIRVLSYDDNESVLAYAKKRRYSAAVKMIEAMEGRYSTGAAYGVILFLLQARGSQHTISSKLFDTGAVIASFLTRKDINSICMASKTAWMQAKEFAFLSNDAFKQSIFRNPDEQEIDEAVLSDMPEKPVSEILQQQFLTKQKIYALNAPSGLFYRESVYSRLNIAGLRLKVLPNYCSSFFRAVAVYLGMNREQLCSYIAERLVGNENKYGQYFTYGIFQNYSYYVELIRNESRDWSSRVEPIQLMQLLQQPIFEIDRDGKLQAPNGWQQFNGSPIFIYRNDKHHVDAFELTGEYAPKEILANLEVATDNRLTGK